MKKYILSTAAWTVLGLAAASPALAQTDGSAADMATIEEVVVTAQRFSESAQKTPLVITALNEEALAGVTDIRQLQTLTPGITLSSAGNLQQTFVRGVGSTLATNAQESAIAYNADGVFLFTSTMVSPLMYDLERVEILKGPQGTLYGRNASGGAVNLITRGASLEQVEGYVEGEVGNFDLRRVVGAVNIPLSDTFAVRLAAQHAEHEGYLSDGMNDQDVTSGRVRVLWQPSEDITLRLGLDASKDDSKGAGTSIEPNLTGDDFVGALDPRVNNGVGPQLGGQSILSLGAYSPTVQPPRFKDDQWSVYAQLDWNLGFANLTVVPAYRSEELDQLTYVPGYFYSEQNDLEQKSFEARLSNQTDRLRWVAGAYYFDMEQTMVNTLRNDAQFQGAVVNTPKTVESYAFFGEATFSVTDTFRLIGGLRYSHEESKSTGTANAFAGPPGVLNPVTGLPNVQTTAFNPFGPGNFTGELLDYRINSQSEADATTWKIGAEWDIAEDSLLFFTASKGFKGGGSYVDIPSVDSSFEPEFLTAYTLGSRNRFFDNRLQLNGELFLWKLKDQQVSYVGFNAIGNVNFITVNAGSGEMYGANLDLIYKLTAVDTFHLGVEYLHAEYDSFVRNVPSLAALPTTACRVGAGYNPTPGSTAPTTLDCSGLQMLRAPEWTISASYEHVFELGNGGNVTAGVDGIYLDERWLDGSYGGLAQADAATVWNASLVYNAPDDQWAVEAWVRNIGDERVEVGTSQFFAFYARPTLQPPRTYGVRARYNF